MHNINVDDLLQFIEEINNDLGKKIEFSQNIIIETNSVKTQVDSFIEVEHQKRNPLFLIPIAISITTSIVFLKSVDKTPHYVSLIALVILLILFITVKNKYTEKEPVKEDKLVTKYNIKKGEINYIDDDGLQNSEIVDIGASTLNFSVRKFADSIGLFINESECPIQQLDYPIIEDSEGVLKNIDIMNQKDLVPFILSGDSSEYISNNDVEVVIKGYENEVHNIIDQIGNSCDDVVPKTLESTICNNLEIYNVLSKVNKTSNFVDPLIDEVESIYGHDIESTLSEWASSWNEKLSLMDFYRNKSTREEICPTLYEFFQTSLFSDYVNYCPVCNAAIADEIQNKTYSIHEEQRNTEISETTRCYYDITIKKWVCPVCGEETEKPIRKSKSYEEVIKPLYNNLIRENYGERLKAETELKNKEYNKIDEVKKEKRELFHAGFEKVLEKKDKLDEYNIEYLGESESVDYINEIATQYKNLQSNVIRDICVKAKHDVVEIQELQNEIVGRLSSYKNEQMDLLNEELTTLSKAKKLADMEREARELAALNEMQKVNDNLHSMESTYIEQSEYDRKQKQQHHRENIDQDNKWFKQNERHHRENLKRNKKKDKNEQKIIDAIVKG